MEVGLICKGLHSRALAGEHDIIEVESSTNSFVLYHRMEDAQRQGPQQTIMEQVREANHFDNHTNHDSNFKYANNFVNNAHDHENFIGKFAGRTSGHDKSEVKRQNECQQEKVYDKKVNNNTTWIRNVIVREKGKWLRVIIIKKIKIRILR